MTQHIPFNRPYVAGNESVYMAQAVANMHLSGDGIFTKRCHTFLEDGLGTPKALLTTSCTHALEMSALLLDLQAGDEVIVPSFTFVSTINAFVLRGAKPVFVDIRPDTLNIDETKIEQAITPHTKAIVVVHYASVACEMESIVKLARAYHLALIEDNAHGLFARYNGAFLGTFGTMATQSFHETKNFTCGEGGALLINAPDLIERAEIIREKGTNRSRFFRGQVDKYTWVDVGSSYLPSDLLAAFLYAQFEARDDIQRKRQHIWETYSSRLSGWAVEYNVILPTVPDTCEQVYHMFYMRLPSLEIRTAFIDHLNRQGIYAVFHYLPLHLSDMGMRFGGHPGDCPVTEQVSDQLVRLPFYTSLSESDQEAVIEAILDFAWEPFMPAHSYSVH